MSIENDEVMVRVYGNAVVVTGRSTTKRDRVAKFWRGRFVSHASMPGTRESGKSFRRTTRSLRNNR
jgi:hypothetical protein